MSETSAARLRSRPRCNALQKCVAPGWPEGIQRFAQECRPAQPGLARTATWFAHSKKRGRIRPCPTRLRATAGQGYNTASHVWRPAVSRMSANLRRSAVVLGGVAARCPAGQGIGRRGAKTPRVLARVLVGATDRPAQAELGNRARAIFETRPGGKPLRSLAERERQ